MINTKKQGAMLLFFATLLTSNVANANVSFQDPNTASWGGWTRGDANTSFVHWAQIDALVDHSPDAGDLGTSYAVLAANNSGAFITGGGAGGNVYSFSDTPDFTTAIQTSYSAPTDLVTVALQLKILGTDLDTSSITLGNVAWDSSQTLFSGAAGGPFGGLEKEYLFIWNNVTADTVYELDFLATGSSMSLDEVSIDVGVSAVPIPAAVWMFMTALSGLAVTSRRKARIA